MEMASGNESKKRKSSPDRPYHVSHETFEEKGAEKVYGPASAGQEDYAATYMPDEVTRDFTRRITTPPGARQARWTSGLAGAGTRPI